MGLLGAYAIRRDHTFSLCPFLLSGPFFAALEESSYFRANGSVCNFWSCVLPNYLFVGYPVFQCRHRYYYSVCGAGTYGVLSLLFSPKATNETRIACACLRSGGSVFIGNPRQSCSDGAFSGGIVLGFGVCFCLYALFAVTTKAYVSLRKCTRCCFCPFDRWNSF